MLTRLPIVLLIKLKFMFLFRQLILLSLILGRDLWRKVDSPFVVDLLKKFFFLFSFSSSLEAKKQLVYLSESLKCMDFKLSHIFREGNQVAYKLASYVLHSP